MSAEARTLPCHRVPGRVVGRAAALALLLAGLAAPPASALVINEIQYHSQDVDDRPYEWIELFNENPDPLDLSGFTICNGVDFVFPAGTFLDGRSFVIVCADPTAFASRYTVPNGVPVVGPWTGALDNAGERIEICNTASITVAEVDYNDRGKWLSAADGTGHTLSLISPFIDFGDPDSWTHSTEVGGTPGEENGHIVVEGGAPPTSNSGLDFNGFLLHWLVLGPYNGSACNLGDATLRADWLRESAGGALETHLLWADRQVVNTNYSLAQSTGLHPNAGTAVPTIKRFASFADTVNFNDNVWAPDPNNVMGYAFTYVDNVTGSNLLVDVACASDDAIAVLINGAYVHVNDACRGAGAAGEVQDRAPAVLEPGKNLVAVKVFEAGGGWSFRLRFEGRGTGTAITSNSQIQVTTDHTLGMDFNGGGTPIEPPDDPGPGPGTTPTEFQPYPVAINEALIRTGGERWVELYNRGSQTVDLAGFYMTDTPGELTKSRLAAGTQIAPGGFLVLTEAALGLSFQVNVPGDRVFIGLVDEAGERVLDAYAFEPAFDGMSEARIPDGSREFSDAADPTRGVPNAISPETAIVINEVMYHPIDEDLSKEWIELYNRGAQAVDLTGWEFTSGFNFAFPPGTNIAPDGYLVVARDPALVRGLHALPAGVVIGPDPADPVALEDFGRLRDGGERITLKDELGRTVDTVRYFDGGDWPRWADGHGSSMELLDPRQDNGFGQAWDSSDDAAKATTRTFSYVGRHGGGESELAVALLSRGIAIVDDISIKTGGLQVEDTPIIPNGATWRYFKGTENPPAGWNDLGFNDASWLSGAAGIGYADGDDATVLTDMQGAYRTIFCRRTFDVPDPSAIDELFLSIIIDDGFNAYLNGEPVASFNVSGATFDSDAISAVADGDLLERDLTSFKGLLVAGQNVLAFSVHNAGLASSDLSFHPQLINRTTTAVGGGVETLANGHFNSSAANWIIEGTHGRSGRTTLSPIAGAGSLKLIATGRGDNKVNRIETPDLSNIGLSTLPVNQDLAISFRARWVVGSQSILTNGYEHAMARSHDLGVPSNLGTPGRINSVTLRLSTRAGSINLGPVIDDVAHFPVVPDPGQTVTVRCRVSDADGVGTVRLFYSLNNPSASPAQRTMSHQGGGIYQTTIPGQTLNTRVVFFITATDATGQAGRYPEDVTLRTHPLILNPAAPSLNDHRYLIYRHDERSAQFFHRYRFFMTQADEDYLSTRRLLSNDLVPGSFLFNSSRMYYESQTRFAGSPFARGGWGGSFRVALPRDDELHGRIHKFNIDNHHSGGLTGNERISHYLLRLANGAGTPIPYSDTQTVVQWAVNSRGANLLEQVWVPDVQFIDKWYPDDADGDFLEMDDRFLIRDDGSRQGNTDGRVLYPPPSSRSDGNGENKENYRWFFGLRTKNGADDFSSFIDFAQLMDPSASSSGVFDANVFDNLEVEEFLRVWAVRHNTDDWDTWGANRGKNCYFYRGDVSGLWSLHAWDMELTYGNVNSFIIPDSPASAFNPGGFAEVHRMLNRPHVRRLYYAILEDMVNGPGRWFHSSRLSTYMTKLAAIGMGNTNVGQPGGFIDQRAALVAPRIQSVVYPTVRLRITTNSGNNFSVNALTVDLAGTAPVDIATVIVNESVFPTSFPAMTTFNIDDIELIPGVNELTLFGFDMRGNLLDSDTITVTSTVTAWGPPVITALTPDTALPGTDIQITGSELHNGLQVFFGATAATSVTFNEGGPTPNTITARVPSGVGAVQVTVRNVDGKTSNGLPFTFIRPPATFVRGDANRDGRVDVSDAAKVLFYLFRGQSLDCEDAADVDDSETVNVTDAILLLEFLFKTGARPRSPYPNAGNDPAGATLGCEI